MQTDSKIILFFSISVVLLSLYYIWQFFFIYVFVFIAIYYDYNSQISDFQGHGFNKVKTLLEKVRIFVLQTVPSLYFIYNSIEREYNNLPLKEMFTQSSWDSKRNSRGNSLTPIACIGSNSVTGKYSSSPIYKGVNLTKITPVKPSRLRRPENYSLSDTSYITNNTSVNIKERESSPICIPNAAGPLLASSRYNVGLGMLADTQSPGLTSRIVQYNDQYNDRCRKETITHLPKYGSAGKFPNVNLNKSPLKTINPTVNKPVTVRIAPPENTSYSAVDRNLILNGSLHSLQNSRHYSTTQSEISTRSVLDALKEISRKRIHARDDSSETNKKQRKNSVTNQISDVELVPSSKRCRDNEISTDTPYSEASSSSPSPKKQKHNGITSSLSSSVQLRQQYTMKRKLGSTQDEVNKQLKLSSPNSIKFTETYYDPLSKTISHEESADSSKSLSKQPEDQSQLNITKGQTKKQEEKSTNVKNFNEGAIVNENGVCRLTFISNPPEKQEQIFVPFKPPSEESKKKRLAALLKALSGEEWDAKTLTSKFFPDEKATPGVNGFGASESVVSSTDKIDGTKSVSFDLTKNIAPDEKTTSSFTSSSDAISTLVTSTPVTSTYIAKPDITTTSNSITQPISSTFSFGSNNTTSNAPSSLVEPPPQVSSPDKTTPGISSVKSFQPTVVPSNAATSLSFPQPTVSSTPTVSNVAQTSKSETSTSSANLFNFGTKSDSSSVEGSQINSTITEQKRIGGFSFDLNKTSPSKVTSTSLSSNTAPTIVNFGSSSAKSGENHVTPPFANNSFQSSTPTAVLNTATSSSDKPVTNSQLFSFGTKLPPVTSQSTEEPTIKFVIPKLRTTTANTLNNITFGVTPFGANTRTTNNSSFSASNTFTTPQTTTSFGATPQTTASFGATPQTTASFGASPQTTASFGATLQTAASFGATPQTAASFGATPQTTASFGTAPQTAASFGTTSQTTTASFGTTSNTQTTSALTNFGTTNTFGKPGGSFGSSQTSATTATSSLFNTNAAPSVFGAVSTITATTTAPTTAATTVTSTTLFGTVPTTKSTSAFGAATPSLFGSNTANSSGFGSNTSNSGFGSNLPAFGASGSTPNMFNSGTSNAFPPATNATVFGNTAINEKAATFRFGGFGTNVTTSATFDTTTSPAVNTFGTSVPTTNAFGSVNPAPGNFASSTSSTAIALPASNAFGSPATNNFGTTNIFNTSSTEKPANFGTVSVFNNTAPNFGANTVQNNNSAPAFGAAPNASDKPAVFGGFGGSTSGSNVFAFGATATQNNNNTSATNNAFQFNAPKQPVSGGFNFNANATNFNANPSGSMFNIGASSSGNMFSIGTSSTAPRLRATPRYNRKK